MSRHLFVGADVAGNAKLATGLMADGAIGIEVAGQGFNSADLDADLYVAANNAPTDTDQIRILLGTGSNMLVSPWISRRNVIAYSGQSGAAAVAHQGTVTAATTSTAAGEVVIKFVRTDGPRPEFFSFTTEIASGTTATNAGVAIDAAFDALDAIPEWLNSAPSNASGVVTFSGSKRGDTTKSGGTWDYAPAIFDVIVESNSVGSTTFTAASGSQKGDPGVGDGYAVLALEESLHGVSHGYYDRLKLPNKPATNALVGTSYDMITLVATKDGSTSPQIKGVDNLIEIMIALPAGFSAATVVANLNDYLAGDFAAVSV